MGIFSFLSSIGQKISNGEVSAESLKKNMDSFNLGTEDVKVSVSGDKVELSGKVKDQSVLEKAVLAVGNMHGVSEVKTDNLVVADNTATSSFYTVKPGDNLWKIAEDQYGKGKGDKNNIIFEANKPMLTSPDKIFPGQVLRIPPLEKTMKA